jgi:uncharacterized membrane protein YhaH (DUF805 family)
MNWYLQALRHYADFSGRARRKEFWIFILINILIYLVLYTPTLAAESGEDRIPGALLMVSALVLCVFILATLLPSWAVCVRRLHDIDRSGLWLLIGFIPIIGNVILLVFGLPDGTPGPNRYGPDPKGRSSS